MTQSRITWQVINADVIDGLRRLPDGYAHCCVTSPPYWGLRDYGVDGQIGLEETPEAHIARLVEVFREVGRVLRDDGVMFVNYGDAYAQDDKWGGASGNKNYTSAAGGISRAKKTTGLKSKDLIGLPWMLAFALRADGWYLRQDIIWHKPNPMPESVTDRCTKAHEYLFLLSKSQRYYYDAGAIAEASIYAGDVKTGLGTSKDFDPKRQATLLRGERTVPEFRNRRSVWSIPTQPYPDAHFATFPEALVEPCIKAGSPVGGMVLDPFGGSGTTAVVALKQGRSAVVCELNPAYAAMARRRIGEVAPLLATEAA